LGQVACSTRSSPASAPPRGEEPTTKGAKHAKGEGKGNTKMTRGAILGGGELSLDPPRQWQKSNGESWAGYMFLRAHE
jgi:hypothetical protein